MSGELHTLELTELAALIAARKVSPVDLASEIVERIDTLDPTLHAYAARTSETALVEARTAEAEIVSGRYRGPLHGIPIGIKDLFWTKGVETAAGTTIHKGFVPDEDATVVHRLRGAGAVALGKLQMTEGAYSDHHPSVVPPVNPWHPGHWTGISSSGAAVATAAGLCIGSIASDTGGSIRWPCAANGLTGLKPTWGRVSRHGMFELAPSLDHVGPIARSAADVAVIFGAIAGLDPHDPTTLIVPPILDEDRRPGIRGMRLGIDPRWNSDVDSTTRRRLDDAVEAFRDLGATIVDVDVPDARQAVEDWFPCCGVEAAVAYEMTYPSRRADYGPALASVIEAGRTLPGIDYQKVLVRRRAFRGQVARLFETIDTLLTPVQPFAAPTVETMRTFVEDPDFVAALLRYTSPFDMTGHPALAFPSGFTDKGLPVGIQLVAADLDEQRLLRAGIGFQGATGWHRRRPPVPILPKSSPAPTEASASP